MSVWGARKSKIGLAALLSSGWRLKRQSGSHRVFEKTGRPDFIFAFHDGDEIGPRMLARIARQRGLELEVCEYAKHVRALPPVSVNSVSVRSALV